jgi:hypothetical protein
MKEVKVRYKGPVHYLSGQPKVEKAAEPPVTIPPELQEAVLKLVEEKLNEWLGPLQKELEILTEAFRKNEQLIWQFHAEWQVLKDRLVLQAPEKKKRERTVLRPDEGVGIFSAFRH